MGPSGRMPASTEPHNPSIVYLPYCPLYCPLLQTPLAAWYAECAMARVNNVKQIKIDGNWVLRSIPRKPSGTYDWTALSEGTYFIEWRDSGQRKREPAGITASQALEAQRKKRHSLEGRRWDIGPSVAQQSVDAGKDRKSTRLNSSHRCISYAVFCLK